MISKVCNDMFDKSIQDYHLRDDVDAAIESPYPGIGIEHLLYAKNWVDAVQWHLEDIVRNPQIDPREGLSLKRRIDASNQVRNDMVEHIDGYFFQKYDVVQHKAMVRINTESPAWEIERLSILALKIYNIKVEVKLNDASAEKIIT